MTSPVQPLAPLSVLAKVDDTVFALRKHVAAAPRVGVVLGSGLGAFGDTLEGLRKVPYGDLPHMPQSSVVGHPGNFCFGKVDGVDVVCMQGRAHLYEGHPPWAVVHGVRSLARLGVGTFLLTNAAGGMHHDWAPGDLMLVTDHINLMGVSPLTGPNESALGTRFPDMGHAYDPELARLLREVATEAGIELREGVYAATHGPAYETPAEVRMLLTLGADAVGMSTVPEVIALRHMGARVGAMSCITNLASGISKVPLDHAEVERIARERQPEILKLLTGWIVGAGGLP